MVAKSREERAKCGKSIPSPLGRRSSFLFWWISTTTAKPTRFCRNLETNRPLAWYERDKHGGIVEHIVSDHSYGHGIGVGDVNGDGRNDILTPKGWLEAPA